MNIPKTSKNIKIFNQIFYGVFVVAVIAAGTLVYEGHWNQPAAIVVSNTSTSASSSLQTSANTCETAGYCTSTESRALPSSAAAVTNPAPNPAPAAAAASNPASGASTILTFKNNTGTTAVQVGIANTPAEQQQGLSDTSALGSDQGLLFVFSTADTYGFWMKDMNYPLDMIWFDQNFNIVDITRDATPESYPKVFYPSQKVLYVLEVNANFTSAHGLEVGDHAVLSEK
jgi:uncharacterized protein